ncbi:aldo/keto reductase [Natranaeroarchaeum sulfidigenes]|uniref:Aryl-alcohol dehydrogenase related enzyme n=1 Tax=Natranaeroarchaeum sulfidigenes TaxID=2784880 RepID=A0A897MX97_9EURY|nr:aldo/keto reductase [Natranaeroarchaeum sulfidigenes]QSG02955.1 Aryl-alcohol dehydrogenase related enzyme [Natranaeroarchaeum sulfidigenes]
MRTTPLGTTGEEVSSICLGPMIFGTEVDRETSFALLDRYYEAGGRFLDTANNYATWIEGYDEPRSEPLLGDWLDERGVREEMFIATKLGFNYGETPQSLAPEVVEQEIAGSLDRLGIDQIDLLYAHVDDFDTPQEETMRAFQRAIDAGKVRHLGASNFLGWRLARANRIAEEQGLTPYQCVQPRFSYYVPNRGAEFGGQVKGTDELLSYATHDELTVLPYSPTLGGCYGREDRGIPEGYVNTENRVKRDIVDNIADEKGLNGNQIALAWLLDRDQPTVPVIGVSTREQLDQNLAALDVEFTADERRRLDSVERMGIFPWRD